MFQFPFLDLARLPAYSQECPLLHPGSIHVLNLNLSLQYISNAVKSHVDMCVHTCTYACTECLYLFFLFYKHKTISSHSILLFYHPRQVQLVLSRDLVLSSSFTYFLPSWLLGHQWTLPCESQTLGDTGYNQGSWDPHDHHALE